MKWFCLCLSVVRWSGDSSVVGGCLAKRRFCSFLRVRRHWLSLPKVEHGECKLDFYFIYEQVLMCQPHYTFVRKLQKTFIFFINFIMTTEVRENCCLICSNLPVWLSSGTSWPFHRWVSNIKDNRRVQDRSRIDHKHDMQWLAEGAASVGRWKQDH